MDKRREWYSTMERFVFVVGSNRQWNRKKRYHSNVLSNPMQNINTNRTHDEIVKSNGLVIDWIEIMFRNMEQWKISSLDWWYKELQTNKHGWMSNDISKLCYKLNMYCKIPGRSWSKLNLISKNWILAELISRDKQVDGWIVVDMLERMQENFHRCNHIWLCEGNVQHPNGVNRRKIVR